MADHYIDFSAVNNGDGTTAAQASGGGGVGAFNSLVGITFVAGDNYWIRRSGSNTLVAAFTLSVGCNLIGWPISGDTFYATRPASGTSNGWDSDGQTYAQITSSTVSLGTSFFIVNPASGAVDMERLKVSYSAGTQTSGVGLVDVRGNTTFNNCWFLNSAALSSTAASILLMSTNTPVLKATSTIFEFSGAVSGSSAYNCFNVSVAADTEFINCTFTFSGTPTGTSGVKCVASTGGSNNASFAGCTFTRTGTAATATLLDFSTGTGFVAMYQCTISDSSTAAATQLDTTNASGFIAQRLTMTAGRRINLGKAGHYAHFSTLTQTIVSSDYFVQMVSGACLVANNFTELAGNTSGAINGQVLSSIYLQNTSFASANPFGTLATMVAEVFEADSGGTYGNWKFTGRRGTVQASAVYRSGGEAFSLKYNMTSGSQNFLAQLAAMLNGLETIFAALVTGNTTITIYGAHKLYSPAPDASQIWADCDYVDVGSGSHRAFASSRGNPAVALTSDSSSWVGDTGLTSFKLTMTVAPGQNCLAPLRIFSNLRQSSAYFYIDPRPVVS